MERDKDNPFSLLLRYILHRLLVYVKGDKREGEGVGVAVGEAGEDGVDNTQTLSLIISLGSSSFYPSSPHSSGRIFILPAFILACCRIDLI